APSADRFNGVPTEHRHSFMVVDESPAPIPEPCAYVDVVFDWLKRGERRAQRPIGPNRSRFEVRQINPVAKEPAHEAPDGLGPVRVSFPVLIKHALEDW